MTLLDYITRSLKWKLVSMITLVLLSVVISVVYFTYHKTTKTVEKDALEFSSQILKQVNLNLNRYLLGYQQSFLAIAGNRDTEKWLAVEAGDDLASYITFQEVVNNYLQIFIYQHPEVMSLIFYNANGNEMHFTNRYGLEEEYDFIDEQYMEKMGGQKGIYFDVTFSNNYVMKNLPVMTMVKRVSFGNEVGYIKLDIDLAPAVDIVNDIELGSSGLTLISDAQGKIIAHPDLQQVTTYLEKDMIPYLSEKTGSFYRGDTDEIVMFQTVPYTNWKVLTIIPYYEFAESVYHIRYITISTLLVGVALSLAIIILFSSSFTRRIGVMKNIMSKVKIGSLHHRVPVKGQDEIAALGSTYNTMLDYLEDSIQQLADSKLQEQEATLSALQSQIDAHFLYNTLESINSMANLADHREIEQMTIALSKMLRYTSDYKSTVVSVEDELRHLQHYLQINQIRFGSKLSYRLSIDDQYNQAQCLKAVIQPMVENSIKHNLEVNGKPLEISVEVTGIEGAYVQVRVADNGTGFSPAKLRELQGHIASMNERGLKRQSNQIGLLNVHSRLRVYYAASSISGVSVDNVREGSGALVTVTFPLQFSQRRE